MTESGTPPETPAKAMATAIEHHVKNDFAWELPGPHGLADHYQPFQPGDWMLFGLDVTPTRHTIMLWIAGALVMGLMWLATRRRGPVPRGRFQTAVEMLVLFIRDELARRNIGHHGDHYAPYLCTVFFFILTMNLLGLIPYSATATGNIHVTAVLAIATFLVTQIAGMRAQGVVGYWSHLVPSGVPAWLYPIMIPVEILGLLAKPFALAVRLFANMLAGHIVLFSLIGLTVVFGTWLAPVSVGLGFAIFLLEIFVAFLQAFIFTMLSSLFIGLASHSH